MEASDTSSADVDGGVGGDGRVSGEGNPEPMGRRTSIRAVLRIRNFRILWFARFSSMIGAQFSMIAMPWLVLQLTGSALAMGTVMAVAGIPRAAFMIVGGAVTDRFSARAMMVAISVVFAVGVALQSALVLTGFIALWMLYVFAFLGGALDAFYFPASATMVPQLVDEKDLPSANALFQGTMQLCMFIGPVVAGTLIAVLSGGIPEPAGAVEAAGAAEAPPDLQGIGIAFGINACTFVIAASLLAMMRMPKRRPEAGEGGEEQRPGMWSSIREGFAFVWQDKSLRAVVILFGTTNFFMVGPMAIGVPVLANSRFAEGAVAYGIIMSGFGAGALLGTLLVATLPDLPQRTLGRFVTSIVSFQGICLVLLGFAPSTAVAASITVLMSTGSGYMTILLITWLQRRTPAPMLGRMMSMIMFAMMGLQPFSMALAGVVVDLNPTALFAVGGGFVLLVGLYAGRQQPVREMGIR